MIYFVCFFCLLFDGGVVSCVLAMSSSVISRFFIDLAHDDNCRAFGKRVYVNKVVKRVCTCRPVATEPLVEDDQQPPLYSPTSPSWMPMESSYSPTSPSWIPMESSWSPTSPTRDEQQVSYAPADDMETSNNSQQAVSGEEEEQFYYSPTSPTPVGRGKSTMFVASNVGF